MQVYCARAKLIPNKGKNMKILVINCGSSSFKYQLIDMQDKTALCSGLVERIGEKMGNLVHKKNPDSPTEEKFKVEQVFADHSSGMAAVMQLLVDPQKGVIASLEEISAVGHRVVQGGEKLQQACLVGEKEKQIISELASLAPLHNPANLQGIEVAQKLLPHAPSVAVFDTEFHATMPAKAYMYALPYELYEEPSIRRYGFHGTSHRYVAETAAEFLGKNINNSGKFADSNNPFVWQISNMSHANNGCHMMFAVGFKANIFQENNLIITLSFFKNPY